MSTTASVIREKILEAMRSLDVSTQAGVAPATWASLSVPHAFDGDSAPIGGRNRGRLPFGEVYIESQPIAQSSYSGGTVTTTVRIRWHVGGANLTAARQKAEGMHAALLAVIRSDQYFKVGNQVVDAFLSRPCWHRLDVVLTVQHALDLDTFAVQ